jgi:thiol:disulfide interchange protein DsbG
MRAPLLLKCLFILALVTASLDVHAAEKPSVADIPPLKEFQDRTNTRIEYMGHKHGMDVWMAVNGPRMQIIYSTPDKKAIIHENTIYSTGPTDETEIIQREFILGNPSAAEDILHTVGEARRATLNQPAQTNPAKIAIPDPHAQPQSTLPVAQKKTGDALWSELSVSRYVLFGRITQDKIVYMFTDPKCSYCHTLWKDFEPLVKQNKFQLRLIPVALLGAESELLSAQWLSQDDPADAWLALIANQKLAKSASPSGASSFSFNQRIFNNYKLLGTPVLVYRQNGQGTVRLIKGNPKDMNMFLKDLGVDPAPKEPEQKENKTKTDDKK